MKRKDGGGPHEEEGGQSKYWNGFCGGLTAPTPRLKNPDAQPPQPRYGDEWANSSAGLNPKGPDIDSISKAWPYRGPGR